MKFCDVSQAGFDCKSSWRKCSEVGLEESESCDVASCSCSGAGRGRAAVVTQWQSQRSLGGSLSHILKKISILELAYFLSVMLVICRIAEFLAPLPAMHARTHPLQYFLCYLAHSQATVHTISYTTFH